MSKSPTNSGAFYSPWFRVSLLAVGMLVIGVSMPHFAEAQNFGLDGGEAASPAQRARKIDNQSGVSADGKFDVSVSSGVRTIKIKDTDRNIEIIEDESGPVSVMVSRDYTQDDMEELSKKSPKLAEYLQNVPASIDGLDVEVSVRLSNTGSADSPELLEKNHRGLYNIYKRYLRELKSTDLIARGRGRGRAGRGAGGLTNGVSNRNDQQKYRLGTTATSKNYDLPTAQVGPDSKTEEKVEDRRDREEDR